MLHKNLSRLNKFELIRLNCENRHEGNMSHHPSCGWRTNYEQSLTACQISTSTINTSRKNFLLGDSDLT